MIEKEVNPHFEDFLFDWSTKFQFLVGGYGSSKSYHVALKLILKMLEEKRTALVVREVYDTHRDSTYSLLEELVIDLGLDGRIKCMTSGKISTSTSCQSLKLNSLSLIQLKMLGFQSVPLSTTLLEISPKKRASLTSFLSLFQRRYKPGNLTASSNFNWSAPFL